MADNGHSGTRDWVTLHDETLWRCGCRQVETDPPWLVTFCGQPDCLRLFEAEVAYTAQQFAWQQAHGADPSIVDALLRPMVTPLPQILPPPPAGSGQYFSEPLQLIKKMKPMGRMKSMGGRRPPQHTHTDRELIYA
jgi:hypothetical protein